MHNTIFLYLSGQCTEERNHDIYFVIDGSRSIRAKNFQRVRKFLHSFINHIEIGPDKNHIGLIQFSEENLTTVEFGFEDTQQKEVIFQKLNDLRYQSGRATFTGVALKIILDSVRLEVVLCYHMHINHSPFTSEVSCSGSILCNELSTDTCVTRARKRSVKSRGLSLGIPTNFLR